METRKKYGKKEKTGYHRGSKEGTHDSEKQR
jgi:hypothetical protein